ncbi:MAG: AraC family transcriptional regulator [Ruminococcus flavefaciens]|nr:AraC family transcriptional regulator [Ruminococcus flavefaciens]
MDIQKILLALRQLEPMEQAGLSCFQRTGKAPDFFEVYFQIAPDAPSPGGAADGGGPKGEAPARAVELFHAKYAAPGLPESIFLPERTNVELEHLLRYVDIVPHRHDFFELVCVLEGGCVHGIEDQTFQLKQGDITIVPPQLCHHLEAQLDCVCLTIKVRTSTFQRTFSSLLQEQSLLSTYFTHNLYMPQVRSALTFHCGDDPFVQEHLLYMYQQQTEQRAYCDNIIEGLISVLFSYLLQNYQDGAELSQEISQHEQRLAQVLSYLSVNYQRASLTDTAKAFFMSPSYLSSSLHKFTGRTFSEILRMNRMRRAAELLVQTDLKLEGICEQIGYQDVTQFIRYFKKAYHCTPHVYRKKRRPQGPGPG